jgi:hypothetical protein
MLLHCEMKYRLTVEPLGVEVNKSSQLCALSQTIDPN